MKTLEYLHGIAPQDCRRLRARGVGNTNQLLHLVALDIDRQRLSKKTGISKGRLLEFGNECGLLEVSGLDPYLPLVRRLGITSLKLLKQAASSQLHQRLVTATGFLGAPSLSSVEYWISQARTCDIIEDPA